MSLNSEKYSVQALSQAINNLPYNPTTIRDLKIFSPQYQTTTFVTVERKDNYLSLVTTKPRGAVGEPIKQSRYPAETFHCLHLPKNDIVLADDVQNVRAFGDTVAETVASKVLEKLAMMKLDIEYTQEHLMLGALLGKIVDADGTELIDIYKRFGLTRATHTIKKSENIGKSLDVIKSAMNKKRGGDAGTGFIVLASPEFMQEIKYHDSVKEIYLRHQEAKAYRDDTTHVAFNHMGIDFVQYDHEFASGVKIKDGEAIILPKGTRQTFCEFYAPANMIETVNTKALPYYASRKPLDHNEGWDLKAQSNPLPLVLRPEAVATLKLA